MELLEQLEKEKEKRLLQVKNIDCIVKNLKNKKYESFVGKFFIDDIDEQVTVFHILGYKDHYFDCAYVGYMNVKENYFYTEEEINVEYIEGLKEVDKDCFNRFVADVSERIGFKHID